MNVQKLFLVTLLIVVFTTNTFAQATATATATATIITPITITKPTLYVMATGYNRAQAGLGWDAETLKRVQR